MVEMNNDFIAADGSQVPSGSTDGLRSLNSLVSDSLSSSMMSSFTLDNLDGMLFVEGGVIPAGIVQVAKKKT